MRTQPLFRSLFALGLFLASCSDRSIEGGSGTEAGNGLQVVVMEAGGAPAVGARVELRSARSESLAPLFTDTTGTDGTARLDIPEGLWTVLVRKGDRAFWARSTGSGRVRDTLRPTSSLSGIVEGGAGNRVQTLGLGTEARCDLDGFFHMEGIPSGQIPLGIEAQGSVIPSTLELAPGIHAIAIAKVDSIPERIRSIASDSLIPWYHRPLPALLPHQALGDTGKYWVAVRIHRERTTVPVWAISWKADEKSGIRVGWQGLDTMILEVNGKSHVLVGYPLNLGAEDVGLSWDGHLIQVWRGEELITALTDNSGSMGRRSTWSPPEFGAAGVTEVDWIAYKRGVQVEDWFDRLSGR